MKSAPVLTILAVYWQYTGIPPVYAHPSTVLGVEVEGAEVSAGGRPPVSFRQGPQAGESLGHGRRKATLAAEIGHQQSENLGEYVRGGVRGRFQHGHRSIGRCYMLGGDWSTGMDIVRSLICAWR